MAANSRTSSRANSISGLGGMAAAEPGAAARLVPLRHTSLCRNGCDGFLRSFLGYFLLSRVLAPVRLQIDLIDASKKPAWLSRYRLTQYQ